MDDPRHPTEPVRRRPETVLVPFPPAPPKYGLPGAPVQEPPARRSRALLWTVLAVVVVVAVAVVGGVVLTRGGSSGPVPNLPISAPTPTAGPGSSAAPSTTATPDASAARTKLDDQVRADATKVQPLLDTWVPQLYAESAATDPVAQEVLRRYQAAVAAHPGAVLLSSTDYSSFELDGYYVVVMPMPYPTAAEAIAWCRAQSLDAASCYAKRISRTAAPAGSTVYQ